jgi:glycosyltransferase involved in cell wall biosynthesis
MTWEYLKGKTYRYDFIRKHTRALGHVVELCNGDGELEPYLECDTYMGCDATHGVTDDVFVKHVTECDTLIALGHGGYEIDRNPLESATLTQSIKYIMQEFKPRTLILESVNAYQPIINGIVKGTDYVEVNRHEAHGPKWTDERTLRIFTLDQFKKDGLWVDVKIPYEPDNQLALAYNRAMESTTAEWVLLLDHDLFICNPNWYNMILSAIKQLEDRKVGWITAVCNRIGGGPQLKKPKKDDNNVLNHIKIARQHYKAHGDVPTQTDYDLSGFFILTNKTAWRAIGGFRHMGKSIFGIDNDYRKRLAEDGFELYIMEGLYFYHLYREKTNAFKDF